MIRFSSYLMALGLICGTVSCGDDKDDGPEPTASKPGLVSEQAAFYVAPQWSDNLKAGVDATNSVELSFTTGPERTPAESVTVESFDPRMPSMGNHGTNKTKQSLRQTDTGKNTWIVEGLVFTMGGEAGEWVVTIEATVNGKADTIKIPVPKVE